MPATPTGTPMEGSGISNTAPISGQVAGGDRGATRSDDALDDGQSQAGDLTDVIAYGKRFKYPLQQARSNPRAMVADRNAAVVSKGDRRVDRGIIGNMEFIRADGDRSAPSHRVDGIVHEVLDHLAQFTGMDRNPALGHVGMKLDADVRRQGAAQGGHSLTTASARHTGDTFLGVRRTQNSMPQTISAARLALSKITATASAGDGTHNDAGANPHIPACSPPLPSTE